MSEIEIVGQWDLGVDLDYALRLGPRPWTACLAGHALLGICGPVEKYMLLSEAVRFALVPY